MVSKELSNVRSANKHTSLINIIIILIISTEGQKISLLLLLLLLLNEHDVGYVRSEEV